MEGTGIEESHLNFTMEVFTALTNLRLPLLADSTKLAILQKERHKCTSNRNKNGISYQEVYAIIFDLKAGNILKEKESSKLESCT